MFWWVELELFSLECNEVFSGGFWGVYGLGVIWEACILMLMAILMHSLRMCVVCLPLELVGSWVGFGFRVGMEAIG